MSIERIKASLDAQRNQLNLLIAQKQELQDQLLSTNEGILQIRGSIAALEYVIGLDIEAKATASVPTVVDAEVVPPATSN